MLLVGGCQDGDRDDWVDAVEPADAHDRGSAVVLGAVGDPEGAPVFALHGTPGGRLNRHPDERAYAAVGVRVFTYDRPGYGGSERMADRSVVDASSDVAALADHLGIGRFAVTGSSGGAPDALAVAARLGERVVRARCNVGVVPYGLEGPISGNKPVSGFNDSVQIAQVTRRGVHDDFGAGNVATQPRPVGHRDEHVPLAVGHPHRHLDLAEVKAPRLHECQVVVDPSPDPAVHKVLGGLAG